MSGGAVAKEMAGNHVRKDAMLIEAEIKKANDVTEQSLLMVEPCRLSDADFKRFAELIYAKCGIKLSPIKKTMLTGRLNRRLRRLGIKNFREYYKYITSPEGEKNELVFMINEVSTNKTDFFREPEHFEYITERILPEFEQKYRTQSGRRLQVWSAGCSSGEEPYTIAMVLAEYAREHSWFDFSITATDISTKVLDMAQKGVYTNDRLVTVAPVYKQRYMMRGKKQSKGLHKIVPELRNKIHFKRLNFHDDHFDIQKMPFDIIFCRNVIIYFDRNTQESLFRKFYRHLAPEGYILIGHSETLPGMDDKLIRVAPAIYRSLRQR